MYRILIVDDENYVVDWLSSILEARTEPELDICRAYSAAEALGWLNRAKIDIVITDIRMPEMNGIALAQKVRQNWPQCKVILLTAHAEFDYAYEAIENDVIGYILKTEDDERILSEVDKAVSLLDREMKNLELLEQVQNQIKNSMSVIRKEILYRILTEDGNRVPEFFEQLKIIDEDASMDKPFILFIGRIENKRSESDIVEKFRQFSSVQKTAEQYLDGYFYCHCVEYALDKIAWLLQAKDDGPPELKERPSTGGYEFVFAMGMLETVQRSCMDTYGLRVSFVIHEEQIGAKSISAGFKALDKLLDLHMAEEAGFVINDKAMVLPTADEGRFSNNIVRFLRDYIHGNITGDVSLVRLSEVSGYNASYLSRFFKETTGERLNEYICREKLSKIREFMEDEKLNIGEIAEKAGFESRTYFNRFMKRVTRMSPQEYREHILRG